MKWSQFYKEKLKQAELQAKDKAVLKPRHYKKLEKLFQGQWLDKNGHTLNNLFTVNYSHKMEAMYDGENALLKLIKYKDSYPCYQVGVLL